MNDLKLFKIRNQIHQTERQLHILDSHAYSLVTWEAAYRSGDLQQMITKLEKSLDALRLASNPESNQIEFYF